MTRKAHWGTEERAEFDDLIEESLAVDASTSVRARRFREGVEDAIQSHRPWAREIEEDALKRGYLAIYKQEVRKGTVLVEVGGNQVERPSMISVKGQDDEGVAFYQLAFYAVMTREQIADKRREYVKQVQAYDANIAMMDRLTAMLDAAECDDLQTAAAKLGVSVEAWVGSEVVAS